MRFKGAALVAFHSAETCRRVHEALLEVYRKANQPPLRIGLSSPLTFQRVHLSHQPWSEIATNQGGGGRYRSWLVDGQKRFFGRTVAIHGFTEDVNPAQVLNLVKGTGVQPIPTAPNAARPGEFVQSVPYVFLFYRSVCN